MKVEAANLLRLLSAASTTGPIVHPSNCVGTTSCRPSCLSFEILRDDPAVQCDTRGGIFALEHQLSCALASTNITSCNSTCVGSCDGTSNNPWKLPMHVHIHEKGNNWNFSYDVQLVESTFTYCSPGLCSKHECTLPEQLGSHLEIITTSEKGEHLFGARLDLTQDFIGTAFVMNETNQLGPLVLKWMDDPLSCRPGLFSNDAPGYILPHDMFTVFSMHAHFVDEGHFCEFKDWDVDTTSFVGIEHRFLFHRVYRLMTKPEVAMFRRLFLEFILQEEQAIVASMHILDQVLIVDPMATNETALEMTVGLAVSNTSDLIAFLRNEQSAFFDYMKVHMEIFSGTSEAAGSQQRQFRQGLGFNLALTCLLIILALLWATASSSSHDEKSVNSEAISAESETGWSVEDDDTLDGSLEEAHEIQFV